LAAVEEGCTNKIDLQALDHFGSLSAWFFHHWRTLMSSETSSAAARYAGSSDFKSAIAPGSIKVNALNESMSGE